MARDFSGIYRWGSSTAATQRVAFTGTAGTIANAVGSGIQKARLVVTAAAYVKIGSSPTATTLDVYMPANVPEVVVVSAGDKVSAVQVSSSGDLFVTALD
jgi:hypothetical protein